MVKVKVKDYYYYYRDPTVACSSVATPQMNNIALEISVTTSDLLSRQTVVATNSGTTISPDNIVK